MSKKINASQKHSMAKKYRHRRVRKKILGTADRPRLCVSRTLKHIYAQIINDIDGVTLVSASSLGTDFKKLSIKNGNIEAASKVGVLIANKAQEKGISTVVFDRGGYPYHGQVKALASAARESGLTF